MSGETPGATLPDDLPENPMDWACSWLDEATISNVQRNPNSMVLVTVGDDLQPTARVVLCKAFITDPGFVVFYTNYRSQKAQQLQANPKVALTFHWDALGRQVRMEGPAVRSPAAESDEYFAARNWGSQIGAWGSDQSAPVSSRQALREQIYARARELGVNVSKDLQSVPDDDRPAIPRPDHWGGIRVWPEKIELWVEGADRINDRAAWTRKLTPMGDHDFEAGPWSGTRLQP